MSKLDKLRIQRFKLKKKKLHKFPRDEALCKRWVKLIGLEGWKPKDSSLLCSDHFPEDSFVVHYNNRERLKPGIAPTILIKKAKFKKQGSALLEKNYRNTLIDTSTAVCFLGNVQTVPMIFIKEENSEPQRNIVLESNCRESEDVFASSSTNKKVLEPSIAIKCIDSPRSGKEILNENCFSYNTLTSANPMEEDQSLTAYEVVLHDHNYENIPQNTKKNLDNLKRKLVSIVKENKALKQRIGLMRKRVETFIGCSKRPKTKKIFTRFCVILLSVHEDTSLKLFNRMLRNKNSRGKFIRGKYPPCSPVFSAVEFCK